MTDWWQGAVFYQVYPRSFADSDGDGIGDIQGIIGRLDHLRGAPDSLGVDAIWLSPVYPSPQVDFGYDVANYTDVDPVFGTLADMDRLIDECHERGLRILLDLVPCHTSDQHPWFHASRSSLSDPHRDWYVWADAAPDGGPPNNWTAVFGGPAWTLDATTGQYFAHTFYPHQPQLNWRNPAMAQAVHAAMRFWLARGIDGFRVDAIQAAVKDERLRDNPPAGPPDRWFPRLDSDFTAQEHLWDLDRPEVHDVVRGLRRVADEYGALLVGELYAPLERLAAYLAGGGREEFQLAFNFELLHATWRRDSLALAIERSEALHPAGTWPTYALSNHDQSRHASRFGRHRARAAAFLLLTLRGAPFLYAGEEIGMVDAPASAMPGHDRAGRDPQRTPMQWDASAGGGFTAGAPWLPLADPDVVNVEAQRGDPDSLLSFYRRLIRARKTSRALATGEHRSIFGLDADALAFIREADQERVLVALNVGDAPCRLDLSQWARSLMRLVGTHAAPASHTEMDPRSVELRPLEGVCLRID